MNQKTLFKLEYDKIIALLEKEATSFRGGQLCRRLKPMTDLHKINTYQEQTAAAYTRIVQKGRIMPKVNSAIKTHPSHPTLLHLPGIARIPPSRS